MYRANCQLCDRITRLKCTNRHLDMDYKTNYVSALEDAQVEKELGSFTKFLPRELSEA